MAYFELNKVSTIYLQMTKARKRNRRTSSTTVKSKASSTYWIRIRSGLTLFLIVTILTACYQWFNKRFKNKLHVSGKIECLGLTENTSKIIGGVSVFGIPNIDFEIGNTYSVANYVSWQCALKEKFGLVCNEYLSENATFSFHVNTPSQKKDIKYYYTIELSFVNNETGESRSFMYIDVAKLKMNLSTGQIDGLICDADICATPDFIDFKPGESIQFFLPDLRLDPYPRIIKKEALNSPQAFMPKAPRFQYYFNTLPDGSMNIMEVELYGQ